MSGLGRANAEQEKAGDRAKAIVAGMTGNGNKTVTVPMTQEAAPKQ